METNISLSFDAGGSLKRSNSAPMINVASIASTVVNVSSNLRYNISF